MSNFHRRDFLTGATALAAGMAAAQLGAGTVEAGDSSFMNNVPDPLLAEKELPTFQLELERRQFLFRQERIGNVVHEARVARFNRPGPELRCRHAGRQGSGPRQKVSAMEVRHGISALERDLGVKPVTPPTKQGMCPGGQ